MERKIYKWNELEFISHIKHIKTSMGDAYEVAVRIAELKISITVDGRSKNLESLKCLSKTKVLLG